MRFKNFSIYRSSCMNAYKNSIREYGRSSAAPGRRKRRRGGAQGGGGCVEEGVPGAEGEEVTQPRLPPRISNRRRAARSCVRLVAGKSRQRRCIRRDITRQGMLTGRVRSLCFAFSFPSPFFLPPRGVFRDDAGSRLLIISATKFKPA